MRVILYNSGLGPKIPTGQKTSTIRCKARCKPGDELSHRVWTGKPYRSPQQEIHRSICKAVRAVSMELIPAGHLVISIDGHDLGPQRELALAKQEGFDCIADLKAYFIKSAELSCDSQPFEGEMIEWE